MTGLVGFEHVGMTSGNLDRTIAFYCDLLGLTLALRKKNERGEMAFLDTGSGMLETDQAAHLSSSTTMAKSSGRAVVYLIWPMAKAELTSVRLILLMSLL